MNKTSHNPSAGERAQNAGLRGALFDRRELAAVLAGLRLYEVAVESGALGPVEVIATDCGTLDPLSAGEAAALCEALSLGVDPVAALRADLSSEQAARDKLRTAAEGILACIDAPGGTIRSVSHASVMALRAAVEGGAQ